MTQTTFFRSSIEPVLKPDLAPPAHEYWSWKPIVIWGGLIALASLAFYIPGIVRPMMLWDDFEIVRRSWTWQDTLANLWYPANEHSMPLGRLTEWLMVCIAGDLSNVAFVNAFQGPLALLGGLVLIYRFVWRELGHPFAGLLAMGLYGVSAQYMEAVYWFSASYSVLSMDMLLLGLLAAQSWLRTGKKRHLFWAAFWSLLSPGWFAIGVLAGPLISLYLLADRVLQWKRLGREVAPCFVPFLGTFISLAITLPNNIGLLLGHQPHIGPGESMHFDPLKGGLYTWRFFVDALLPGEVGYPPFEAPDYMVTGRLMLALTLAAVGWYWARDRRLLVLGLGLVILASWLPLSGRAYRDYGEIFAWKRYRLLPHLGVVFYLCGALIPRLLQLGDRLTMKQCHFLVVAALTLQIALQVPLALHPPFDSYEDQVKQFREVDRVRALCRLHHISGEQAREVLPSMALSECDREFGGKRIEGYDFVEGSPKPTAHSSDEARELLMGRGSP